MVASLSPIILACSVLAASVAASPALVSKSSNTYLNWKTFKANGANLGDWLAPEAKQIGTFYADNGAPNALDEWDFCGTAVGVGKVKCGQALEGHFASWVTKTSIDILASAGINTLRIPMTYVAWLAVPGSQLYTGSQVQKMKTIAEYAISKYNMHVIIGLHSLPGGVNGLDIGEHIGANGWWYDQAHLDSTYEIVRKVLDFIDSSPYKTGYSFSPINEPADPLGQLFVVGKMLSPNGTSYVLSYFQWVVGAFKARNPKIPVVLSDCYMNPSFWADSFAPQENIVFDSHLYYLYNPILPELAEPAVCAASKTLAAGSKFPVVVGEFALQTGLGNKLALRTQLYQLQRTAHAKYLSGSIMWTAEYDAYNQPVVGEGQRNDYWALNDLIKAGVIPKNPALNTTFCN